MIFLQLLAQANYRNVWLLAVLSYRAASDAIAARIEHFLQVISFCAWLKARVLGRPYQEVLLQLAEG